MAAAAAAAAAAASALDTLQRRFGITNFRGRQEEIVGCVLEGVDALVIMPTGGGKSLCYQLPALMKPGVALVVCPLIALMEDQVRGLTSRGIPAAALHSSLSAAERAALLASLELEECPIKVLHITPESMQTEAITRLIQQLHAAGRLSLVAVDEAHCISSWGHDFRPSYRKLAQWRPKLRGVPWMALTATATPEVVRDIQAQLALAGKVFHSSFDRPNLSFQVAYKDVLASPMENMAALLTLELKSGAGVIYTLSRASTEDIAAGLVKYGIVAAAYHAGLPAATRSEVLTKWQCGQISVVVATIAFGMGIDKANVRVVVHWCLPKSLEGYYQEAGRAGRDGLPSVCRLYYGQKDRDQLQFVQRASLKDAHKAAQHSVEATQKVIAFCETAVCRRRALLAHFGETYAGTPLPGVVCCDVCQKCPAMVERELEAMRASHSTSRLGTTMTAKRPRHDFDDDDIDDSSSKSDDEIEDDDHRDTHIVDGGPVCVPAGMTGNAAIQYLMKLEARDKAAQDAVKAGSLFSRGLQGLRDRMNSAGPSAPSLLDTTLLLTWWGTPAQHGRHEHFRRASSLPDDAGLSLCDPAAAIDGLPPKHRTSALRGLNAHLEACNPMLPAFKLAAVLEHDALLSSATADDYRSRVSKRAVQLKKCGEARKTLLWPPTYPVVASPPQQPPPPPVAPPAKPGAALKPLDMFVIKVPQVKQ